ncbi:MAG TPA: trehalose-phosphatase [Rhizomicrobium sp.]|jgi:trehalose 6-phosphate phosphatase|nr:trehalose-phosphatase [Rhizomicrobium sp.]
MLDGASLTAPDIRTFSLATDAFLLDVDGTILDIAPAPEAVQVPPSLKQTLARLQEETAGATALVSGRELAVLDRLFAPLTPAAIGCHGAQWRAHPRDAIAMRSPPLPDEIRQVLLAAVAHEPQIRVEDKRYTLAFHYRAVPERGPELRERLIRCLEPFGSGLRLLHGKLVLEVKPRSFDKGEAIRMLMRGTPFAGRRPVFLGDDTTDEDAFAAARQMGGIGIAIGRPMADAQLMLPDPQAARAWLAALVS